MLFGGTLTESTRTAMDTSQLHFVLLNFSEMQAVENWKWSDFDSTPGCLYRNT